ncbi:hypothetical protein Tco_0959336 [Tanacetum coccineum]
MEHLMKENYKNDKLLSLKPYKITTVTLKTSLNNETPLTAHMCNVAEISPQPLQSLIPPSREVNADDSANKSLSGTFVHPVTQSKATTARNPRKKTIPSSTRPEALNSSRIETSSSSQATHLQPAEEFVVTANGTKNLDKVSLLRTHIIGKRLLFAEFQSLSGHLDHVCKEVSLLHYKVEEMESLIAQKVSDDISPLGTSTPLNKRVVKHMNRQFNIAHKAERLQFVTLQKALTKVLKIEMRDTISLKVSLGMQDEVRRTLEAAVIVDDHAEGEKSKEGQMDENANPATTQGEHSNVKENAAIPGASQGEHKSDNANISSTDEETTLDIHHTANLKTTEDDTDYDELDKEPLSKKFKIMTPIPNFPTPTPLCSIPPKHMMKPAPQQESVQEFTDKLFQTTSSSFSPAPLKEPSPSKDPAKGKGVGIEEPVNLAEIKRLVDLRAQKEELEKALKKLLNLATVKAQVLKWKEHEEKKAKLSEFDVRWNTQRNITPPLVFLARKRELEFHITSTVQLIRLLNHINLDSPEAREMYKIMEIEIESRDDVDMAKEIGEVVGPIECPVMKGLSEYKALKSNIRRIRVKDIVKEVEDYLRTYSSVGMDISSYVEEIR